jgi:hypothetical protein
MHNNLVPQGVKRFALAQATVRELNNASGILTNGISTKGARLEVFSRLTLAFHAH